MARKVAVLWVLAAAAGAGCRGFDTPRTLRGSPRPDDPGLPIDEQQRRIRARYGIYDDDYRAGPRTFTDRYGPFGGGTNVTPH